MSEPVTYLPIAKAEANADIMNADADGWRFVVEYRGAYGVIAVIDDENVFVGYL